MPQLLLSLQTCLRSRKGRNMLRKCPIKRLRSQRLSALSRRSQRRLRRPRTPSLFQRADALGLKSDACSIQMMNSMGRQHAGSNGGMKPRTGQAPHLANSDLPLSHGLAPSETMVPEKGPLSLMHVPGLLTAGMCSPAPLDLHGRALMPVKKRTIVSSEFQKYSFLVKQISSLNPALTLCIL